MITPQSNSHFAHNMGCYYIIFFMKKIFFLNSNPVHKIKLKLVENSIKIIQYLPIFSNLTSSGLFLCKLKVKTFEMDFNFHVWGS